MTASFRERILTSALKRESRVVLALDFAGPYEARLRRAQEVLEATKDGIAAVKVNHHLLLPFGLEGLQGVVRTCRKEGLPLIADLKLNDVESTNLVAAAALLEFGFDAVIANPFVGRDEGLGKMIEWVHSKAGGVILLVYMSHRGAREGYSLKVEGGVPLYRIFAKRAMEWGADGAVVSAKDPGKIAEARKLLGKRCLIFSPGIGAQGGDIRAGAGSGADFVIVGRVITESPDPEKALVELKGG